MARSARIERKTAETDIRLSVDLDGVEPVRIDTQIGFLNHMLELFARHGAFGLDVVARGDLGVDQHHTVEDIGICLGQAVREALGDKRGIRRYGHFTLPMEESLVTVAIDLGGRFQLVYGVPMPTERIGDFDSQLIEDFWHAFASHALMNLHVLLHHGRNAHHIAEAVFKAAARGLRMAVDPDPRITGIPSTKGVL
ncbi:MAG: imidazoleglycerol-phosphate dehydratase HisB [Planctomycetes bacterium]|nr:imidazoleglycerol-phosphate dehydratase HisB [Planctomycetota bacterium]